MSADGRQASHPAVSGLRKLVLAPLLITQALATRRRALKLPEAGGERQGRVGDSERGTMRLLVAGDSSAAGVGVASQDDAVVGHLVRTLHTTFAGDIAWTLRARSGLTTASLHSMLRDDPPEASDIAVVITGVNDVVDRISPARAIAHRVALVDWLVGAGLARHVLFAPLPPIHRFPLLPEPLRRVMGDEALRHDAALARWASTRSDVSRAEIVLDLHAGVMASDGFHPGEPVYRVCGEALGRRAAEAARTLGLLG